MSCFVARLPFLQFLLLYDNDGGVRVNAADTWPRSLRDLIEACNVCESRRLIGDGSYTVVHCPVRAERCTASSACCTARPSLKFG
jgi:hypothetical protein